MFNNKKLFTYLFILSQLGCSGNSSSGNNTAAGAKDAPSKTLTPISLTCPSGYIAVPLLSDYTTQDFCVAKYEMKNNSGAKSEAAGIPWSSINRANSISACRSIGTGYDLISVAQMETIARNISGVAFNWSDGTYDGVLNTGHSDSLPFNTLAANSDDTQTCYGTLQTCSNTDWNLQRRTHVLSTGDLIWDFSGNVHEWAKDDSLSSAVLRGGSFAGNAGVFTTLYATSPTNSDSNYGFRCVFQP